MLSITRKFLGDGAVLFWAALPSGWQDLLAATQLTPSEQLYFDQLKAVRRKVEWLAVRYVLQQVESNARIVYAASGKPLLENSENSIAITHSSNFVAILLGKAQFMGLDMEQPTTRMKRLASRFLAPSELEFVELENALQLCLIWSVKEAVVKATDNRGINFSKDISVSAFVPAAMSGELVVRFSTTGGEHRAVANYMYVNDVVMVWLIA